MIHFGGGCDTASVCEYY